MNHSINHQAQYRLLKRGNSTLGSSSGAAAEQQYSEVCRRGGPQADRCLGLGHQISDRKILPQADHVRYAWIAHETG